MDNVKALNIFEINQVILSFEESYSHICAEQYSSPEYYNKKSSLINQIQEARDSYKKSRDSILKEEINLESDLQYTAKRLKDESEIRSSELNFFPEFIYYSKIMALLRNYQLERDRYDAIIKQAERDYKEADRIANSDNKKFSDLQYYASDHYIKYYHYGCTVREMAEAKLKYRQEKDEIREELINKKKEESNKQYYSACGDNAEKKKAIERALFYYKYHYLKGECRDKEYERWSKESDVMKQVAEIKWKYQLQRERINKRLFKTGVVAQELEQINIREQQELKTFFQSLEESLSEMKAQEDALLVHQSALLDASIRVRESDGLDDNMGIFEDERLRTLECHEKEETDRILRELKDHMAKLREEKEEKAPLERLEREKEELLEEARNRVACLKKQLDDLKSSEEAEIQHLDKCLEAVERENEENKAAFLKRIEEKKEAFIRETESTLTSLTLRLASQFDFFYQNETNIPVGYKWLVPYCFDKLPETCQEVFTKNLKGYFNRPYVFIPVGYDLESSQKLHIEYDFASEEKVKSGIQAFIINCFRALPPGSVRISVLDSIHYNSELLGPLAEFMSSENGIASAIPSNAKEMKLEVSALADHYKGIEKLTGTQSVIEYNKERDPKDRIPYRLLIINSEDEEFRVGDNDSISYLINNARKLGIIVIRMIRRKETDHFNFSFDGNDSIKVINSDLVMSSGKQRFSWLDEPVSLPEGFWESIIAASRTPKLGTNYFRRFQMHAPQKSFRQRRPIVLPFAVDSNDNTVSCSFENETFAAYIMGAAGSGKSTLIHTLIAGLLMNYHPDEVELWLLDFKMLEFMRYVECCPPHVKYLLLEKSEDLVFDIVDQLTEELERRQRLFSRNGWQKLTDVPLDQYLPAIFVIIDEFAQMSQIIKETRGNGLNRDYTLKLENLLAKGRALGFKFIFASQTYTTGISGLTETACKQIQLRFALKNTPDEIKQTLVLGAEEINVALASSINSLPPYETLFKWRNEEGKMEVGHFRNMYTENGEIESLVRLIKQTFHPVPSESVSDDSTYIDKHPILIDGKQPKSFASQLPLYERYEATADAEVMDESDLYIYPGVPCSFKPVKPFLLVNGMAENILLAGGGRDEKTNVIRSIVNSYTRMGNNVEMWAHPRSALYRKYKGSAFSDLRQFTDTADICREIAQLKSAIQKRAVRPGLIVCVGYELITADMELLGDEGAIPAPAPEKPQQHAMPDLNEVMNRVRACTDAGEKRRLVEDYNRMCAEYTAAQPTQREEEFPQMYDARADMLWILKRASNYGLHFVFSFERGQDFLNLRLDANLFRHKILFLMSREEAVNISSSRKASELEEGCFVYTNGNETFTYRPHIHPNVSYGLWALDKEGIIVPKA